MADNINPDHYKNGPVHSECGKTIECIDVREGFPTNLADAIKYIWRCGQKDEPQQELDKAIWYLQREKERLARQEESPDWPGIVSQYFKVRPQDHDKWVDVQRQGFSAAVQSMGEVARDIHEVEEFEEHTLRFDVGRWMHVCSCGVRLSNTWGVEGRLFDEYRDHLRDAWGC